MRTAMLVLGLLAGAGCDGAPFGSSGRAVTGGQPTSGDEAVVALGARPLGCGEALAPLCSGTVIAPRVVLSAGHCFSRGGGEVYAFFGADTAGPGEYRRVLRAEVHPDFDDATNANDLALLLLDADAPVEPAALPAAPLDGGAIGATARVVGFGEDDDGVLGRKREGTATVASVAPGVFRIDAAPGMSCRADSGGPVFVDTGEGEVLAGVTSEGDFACAEYADNVDVGAYADAFIAPFVAASDDEPGGRPAGPIAADAVCAASCAGDEDCPVEMRCFRGPDDEAARCRIASLEAGDLTDACASDDECAGTCARVRAGGPCACLDACGVSGGGCTAGSEPGRGVALLVALVLAAATRSRAPSRRG